MQVASRVQHIQKVSRVNKDISQRFKESGLILLLALVLVSILLFISINNSFFPTGWDWVFHVKYTKYVINTGLIPIVNPFFPRFPHAYTPGAHILTAILGIITGLDVLHLYSTLPALLITPIVMSLYVLARVYIRDGLVALAVFLFCFSALMHPTLYATNGAHIMNSLTYPYASLLVSLIVFPLFIHYYLKLDEGYSHLYFMLCSLFLATTIYTYHIMAVVAIGLLALYMLLSAYGKGACERACITFGVLLCGVMLSSPYALHILISGLPKETSAIRTYVILSIDDYINLINPPLFVLFLLGTCALLTVACTRKTKTGVRRNTLLFSWILFLLIMSESHRFGFYLVNDRFAWHLVMPTSIVAILGLQEILNRLRALNSGIAYIRKKSFRVICSAIVFSTLLSSVFSPGFSNYYTPHGWMRDDWVSGGVKWLQENAEGSMVATDPATGFFISSVADVQILVIPTIMADYYIEGLEEREEDLKKIFGPNLPDSLFMLDKYGARFIYIGKQTELWLERTGRNPSKIFNTPFFKPAYPLYTCAKETKHTFDLDGDTVAETFRTFTWRGTIWDSWVYALINPTMSDILSLRCYFHPKGTLGPIRIFVNNILVAEITANEPERGLWSVHRIKVPKEILKDVNKIFIENVDPHNNWYLDWIGFEPIPANVSEHSYGTIIYEVPTKYEAFSDNFNELERQQTDGSPIWSPLSGVWKIENREYSQSNMDGSFISVVEQISSLTDFTIKVRVRAIESTKTGYRYMGVLVRYQDARNFYHVFICQTPNQPAGDRVEISKMVNGEWFFGKATSFSWHYGEWYTLTVVAVGGKFEVYTDGVLKLEWYDDTFLTGKVGLRTYDMFAHFDDMKVVVVG